MDTEAGARGRPLEGEPSRDPAATLLGLPPSDGSSQKTLSAPEGAKGSGVSPRRGREPRPSAGPDLTTSASPKGTANGELSGSAARAVEGRIVAPAARPRAPRDATLLGKLGTALPPPETPLAGIGGGDDTLRREEALALLREEEGDEGRPMDHGRARTDGVDLAPIMDPEESGGGADGSSPPGEPPINTIELDLAPQERELHGGAADTMKIAHPSCSGSDATRAPLERGG